MAALLIGCAGCSTEQPDLTAQRDGLLGLGVDPHRVYVDHQLTGTSETGPDCARRSRPAVRATPRW